MILKSHCLRQCSLMTDNDFQLQLRLRLIKTLKKQTTTNNDHDNDLIILDSDIEVFEYVVDIINFRHWDV